MNGSANSSRMCLMWNRMNAVCYSDYVSIFIRINIRSVRTSGSILLGSWFGHVSSFVNIIGQRIRCVSDGSFNDWHTGVRTISRRNYKKTAIQCCCQCCATHKLMFANTNTHTHTHVYMHSRAADKTQSH